MTDRVHSLTVVLERDVRADDIEPLANAIKLMRGVVVVEKNVADPGSYMAVSRARWQIQAALIEAFEKLDPK